VGEFSIEFLDMVPGDRAADRVTLDSPSTVEAMRFLRDLAAPVSVAAAS
jgi:hypothetical protein